jgi:hypothetical protein
MPSSTPPTRTSPTRTSPRFKKSISSTSNYLGSAAGSTLTGIPVASDEPSACTNLLGINHQSSSDVDVDDDDATVEVVLPNNVNHQSSSDVDEDDATAEVVLENENDEVFEAKDANEDDDSLKSNTTPLSKTNQTIAAARTNAMVVTCQQFYENNRQSC